MNERIKELYNQSGGLVRMYDGKLTYFPAYHKNVGGGNYEFSSFDPEKFAEMIVKECATAFEAEVDTWKEMDPYQGSMKRKGTQAIKQHFGVKQ